MPCYNPLDLVRCITTWLEHRDAQKQFVFPEIQPWYRGFKGTIEKSGGGKYTTKGILSHKKGKGTATTAVVSELPISLWTEKFKDSVEDLVEGKQVRSYKNYSTDVVVHFELDEMKDGMSCTIENLKMTTTLNNNNMVLFSDKGTITKYADVSTIMENFCHVRYDYYVKRRDYIIGDLEFQLTILRNKMRFLREVMSGSLVIQEIDEEKLKKEMESRNYYKNDKNDKNEDDDTGLKSYGYLLNMNIRSFTRQKVDTLQQEITKLETAYQTATDTSPSQMWRNDLGDFQREYTKHY